MKPTAIPVLPHPILYTSGFNCKHVDWGYNITKPDGKCLADWPDNNNLALLRNPKPVHFFLDSLEHWYEPRLGFRERRQW